jgi:thymidylate synthase (FAD)
MIPQHLQKYTEPQLFSTHGHVRLIDLMGDDNAIVQAARVSYGAGTTTPSDDTGLINYLIRNKHTSPIEMCEIKLHIKMPVHVARQFIRHRTASLNEVSTRYSVVKDEFELFEADKIRCQSKNNKQGSSGLLHEQPDFQLDEDFYSGPDAANYFQDEANDILNDRIYPLYNKMIRAGVAREQARNILPLSTYTEMYWKIDLHNLMHFLKLRLDAHAQLEIRELAQLIANIVSEWCPIAWQAFENYQLNAITLSQKEVALVRTLLKKLNLNTLEKESIQALFTEHDINSKTERLEFWQRFVK